MNSDDIQFVRNIQAWVDQCPDPIDCKVCPAHRRLIGLLVEAAAMRDKIQWMKDHGETEVLEGDWLKELMYQVESLQTELQQAKAAIMAQEITSLQAELKEAKRFLFDDNLVRELREKLVEAGLRREETVMANEHLANQLDEANGKVMEAEFKAQHKVWNPLYGCLAEREDTAHSWTREQWTAEARKVKEGGK